MTQASPSGVYSVVPIVATATLIPLVTLGAPHTICKVVSFPIATLVNCNLSALGCFSQLSTCPTTTP